MSSKETRNGVTSTIFSMMLLLVTMNSTLCKLNYSYQQGISNGDIFGSAIIDDELFVSTGRKILPAEKGGLSQFDVISTQ